MAKAKKPWLERVPVDPGKLTLKELRTFKDADDLLLGEIEGPEGFRYFLRCFRFLTLYAMSVHVEKRNPAFSRCWDDLDKTFVRDPVFEDGVFVQAWAFCDFPCGPGERTILDGFEGFLAEKVPEHGFGLFIDQMRRSRLGLYQEVLSTKKTTKFRELITGQVVSTVRSVETYTKGEIFLTRLVEYDGEIFQFADPKCWPKEHKDVLEGVVSDKMRLYFDVGEDQQTYARFMKLAGPYWFSFVSSDHDLPIFVPDHYLTYLRG